MVGWTGNKQKDGWMDIKKWMDEQKKYMDGWMDKIDGWMVGRMKRKDGWQVGWIDRT